jgi:ligand-binding sensor domain-containing protein
MRKYLSLALLLTILLPTCLLSQEYSYTHYDITDGLAGSTVYCITQDKDGFIWLGTETGLSRFDGTHFRNFTAIDGLPDVEILTMFGDSRGRVWMAPYRPSICYYYKGKIHNSENDSVLSRVKIRHNIQYFAEDREGNILISALTELILIRPDGVVRMIESIDGHPIRNCATVATGRDGRFLVQLTDGIYRLAGDHLTLFYPMPIENSTPIYISLNGEGVIWRKDSITTAVHSFVSGKTTNIPFSRVIYQHNTFSHIGDSLFCFNENSGAREYNLYTGKFRIFLPGKQVSRSFRDAMGNTWFTTLGQGIYRLNSDEFRSIRLSPANGSVQSIRRFDDRLFVGDDHNGIHVFRVPDLTSIRDFKFSDGIAGKISFFGSGPNGRIYAGSNTSFRWISPDYLCYGSAFAGAKVCFPLGREQLLFACHWGVGTIDLRTLKLQDTLFRERATTVFYRNDTVFVGTLNGLYGVARDKSIRFYGDAVPFLRKRISAMTESPDGTLWVASYDAGLIGYRNGQVVAHFSRQQGLTSDICRTLLVHDNSLWVGTDKGLTRVSLNRPGYPMDHYTSQDGLGSEIINTIYTDGPMIYAGTQAGLSFFDETRINFSEGCRLYLLSVQNSGRERLGDSSSLILPYTDKHLRLEFAGISYRSVGDITYQYRMIGLDSAWRSTRETFLEYPTLPSGNYVLQLRAMNKFGRMSETLKLPFEVAAPWWQTTWFYAVSLLSFLSLTWLLVSLRIRQIRKRQREKEALSQRMMEMEHMALQAQMNPHFIFNCLNSIQQYIFDQDIFAANKYLTGFAKLIRATLHNSSKPFIFLSEEISYLSGYLSLEKLRFKEKMDYVIDVDPALHAGNYFVPPMLVQPYVENSMRHGLRHKTQGKGLIRIQFRHEGSRLCVIVEDNGIGRKGAAAIKTREHIEYQSKGMSLTADRIRFINARYGEAIRVEVIDLEDDAGRPTGTRVVIQFPLFHLISENETI